MDVEIKPFVSDRHVDQITALWHSLLPTYSISKSHLSDLLEFGQGSHYVACVPKKESATSQDGDQTSLEDTVVGFVATQAEGKTYADTKKPGYICVLLVDKDHQHQGIGTKLLTAACEMLLHTYNRSKIGIGSVFPRFWPGIPTDLAPRDQDFFRWYFNQHLSWELSKQEKCRDLYLELQEYSTPDFVGQRIVNSGVTFSPLDESGHEECLRKQRANFKNAGWVAAYEQLIANNMSREIMVAYDSGGQQIGWTLMVSPDLPILKMFAFLSQLGPRTGLMACVGVDPQERGTGVGLALVDSAVRDMKKRGLQHIFVDWVALEGWYEKLGFKTWREYETLVWDVKS